MVLYWINNALHSCLKGQPTGNGATPGNKQSLKHRRAPCDDMSLIALTVYPQPSHSPHSQEQECPSRLPAHPIPQIRCAGDMTLHRAVISTPRSGTESSCSNTTLWTSLHERQSSSCPLLQDRDSLFLLQFSFLNFSKFPKARKGGLDLER